MDTTQRQQDIIAEMASAMRHSLYLLLTGAPEDLKRIRDCLERFAFIANVTPQELDAIYDKAHRTGANEEK